MLQHRDLAGNCRQLTFAPQAEIGGDLIVAATCRVQLGAGGAGELGDPAFDRRVQILVRLEERERVVGQLGFDGVEGGEHRISFRLVEQTDRGEPSDVSS